MIADHSQVHRRTHTIQSCWWTTNKSAFTSFTFLLFWLEHGFFKWSKPVKVFSIQVKSIRELQLPSSCNAFCASNEATSLQKQICFDGKEKLVFVWLSNSFGKYLIQRSPFNCSLFFLENYSTYQLQISLAIKCIFLPSLNYMLQCITL